MSIRRLILRTALTSGLAVSAMVSQVLVGGEAPSASAKGPSDAEKRNGLIKRAMTTFEKFDAAAKRGDGPIPAEVWAEFNGLLKEAETVSPKTRVALEHDVFAYRLYEAWYQADAPRAVAAAMYGATLEKSGTLTEKKSTLTLEAKANRCYALVGKFGAPTGKESVLGFNPRYPANIGDVVPTFPSVSNNDTPWAKFAGACPISDIVLNFDMHLSFPGSTTDYDWAFVSWPRESFPVGMAARTGTTFTPCSGPALESAFKHAPPGVLMWSEDGVPGLANDFSQGMFTLRSVDNKRVVTSFDKATAQWPTRKSLANTAYTQDCVWHTGSDDPLVAKMIQCHRDIETEFGPRFEKANAKLDNALSDRQVAAAQKEIDKLKEASAKARATRCQPLIDKVEAEMVAAKTRVNDWFIAGQPSTPTVDVPGFMREVIEGWTPTR